MKNEVKKTNVGEKLLSEEGSTWAKSWEMSSDQVGLGGEGEAHRRQQQEAKGEERLLLWGLEFGWGGRYANESGRSQTGEL